MVWTTRFSGNAAAKATPFTTHADMFLIAITVSKDNHLSIEELTFLPQGRVSPASGGENRIELLDSSSQVLYTFAFSVEFTSTEHGAQEASEASYTFILPYDERANRSSLSPRPARPLSSYHRGRRWVS